MENQQWPDEDEYRYPRRPGSFSVSSGQLICFCLAEKEARLIERKFGIRAVAFYEGERS